MQARWLVSLVCLVVLGAALVSAQTTTTPGAADPPQNFTVVRVVGSASDAASTLNSSSVNSLSNNVNNFGSQAQMWFAFWYPQNMGNDPNSANRDYGVSISPATNVSTQTCLQITGAVCGSSTSATVGSGSTITTTNALYAIHWFDQQIVEGTSYTLAAYSVSNFGPGVTGSSQTQTIPYSGNPIKPSTPTFTFITPTSFVINFQPPQYIGQKGNGPNTGGGNAYILTGNIYEVQIRYPAMSTADTAYPQWYVVNNSSLSFSASSLSTAGTNDQTGLVETFNNVGGTTQYLVANGAYQVRVRALGQWGRGVWSAAGSVTTANTKSTPNALALAPVAKTTMAAGGLYYWSSNLSSPSTQTNVVGSYGALGGKGGNSSGAAIQSYTVQFSVNSPGTTSPGAGTAALDSYYVWNGVTDTVNRQTQQGRVVGGWVSITSASIPATLTTYTVANAGTNIYLRVIASNDNGAGALPSSGAWYNADIAAGAPADITLNILSCWGISTGTASTSCQITWSPTAALGNAVSFSGYGWSAGASASAYATPASLPATLGTSSMRWDFGFNTNDFSGVTAVTAYVDYGVFTTTAPACTTTADATRNPKFQYTYTSSGSTNSTTRTNAAATDFDAVGVAVTSSTGCAAKFPGVATFQTKNAATGNALGSRFGVAAGAQGEILAVGVDWLMVWVNRPQNAGTNTTTAGAVTGYTIRAATGNTDATGATSAATAVAYYTGISSAGAYGTSSSSSVTTDLSFVAAAQFTGTGGVTNANLTNVQVLAGSCVTITGTWTYTAATFIVAALPSTTGLANGQRVSSNVANFPSDATGTFISAIDVANTKFTVVNAAAGNPGTAGADIAAGAANAFMACNAIGLLSSSAYTGGSVFSGALATTTVGVPSNVAIMDVSDYSASLVFAFSQVANAAINGKRSVALGGSWSSGVPSYSFSFSTATFNVPNGSANNITNLTCTSIDSTQQIGAQLWYNCSIPLTMPGRLYTIGGAKMAVGGTTSDTAASANNLVFWSSSERPANPLTTSPVSGTATPKNSYYYATATGFTLFRSVQFNPSTTGGIGQGGYNNARTYSNTANSTATPWRGYVAWLNPTAVGSTATKSQRDELGTATVTQMGTGFHSLAFTQWKATNFNAGNAAGLLVSYSLNVSISTDINQATPPAAQTVITGTTTAATYSTAPTMITTSGNVRRISSTAAWIEFEAPQTQNLSANAWYFAYTCGSATGNTSGTAAATGSITIGVNYGLAVVDVGSGNSGASCAFTVQLGDSTTKGTASGSVSIQLSKTTNGVPGAPGTPIFDQISSGSTVIIVPYPVDIGVSTGTLSFANTNITVTLTSGTTNTGTAVLDGGVGNTTTTYQDLIAYNSGYSARITGFTPASATAVNIAANSAYSIAVTIANGGAASNISAQTTATFTSARNGDIPLAPTITNVTRITSSSVRLTVTRPINVGGSPLASIFGTSTSGIIFRSWGFENGGGGTGLSPLTIAISNPTIQWYTPTQANVVGWIVDVSGGISLTTSGRNYVFYVNADNQFSSTVTGNYVAGTSPLVNLSAATTAIAIPAASGVAPGAALSPTITSYSDTAISFVWSENAQWGSSAVTGYKISRRTGGTGAYTSLSTVTSPYFVQDTGLTAGTAYDYNIVATNGNDATAANVAQTTLATNAAAGAPATPVVLQYADSLVRIYWPQPVAIGGLQGTFAAPQLAGYRATATWASSVQAEVCDVVYSWVGATAVTTGIAAQTDLNGNSYFYYTFPAIPGKAYSFKTMAVNIITPSGGVPTTQLGANSAAVTQTANSIVRPYPLPAVTVNTVGAGYVTFTLASPGTYTHVGTSVASPNSILSGYIGYQILQMSPNTNQTGSTFVADRIWDFTSFGSFGATGVTTSLYANELMANSRYRFKVQHTNGFQTAVQAADITVTTATTAVVPGAVNTIVSNVLAKRSNSISLSWVSPLETGGRGALTQFRVTYVASSSTNVQVNTTAPAIAYNAFGYRAFGMVLGGLSAATQYTIQVYGINSVGTSTAASSFAGTPDTTNGLNNLVTTGQVPNLPTNLAVVTNNNTPKLTLSWTTSVAGSTVTTSQQFNIQTTSDNSAAASAPVSAITTTQVDVTGVVAGGLYRFQLSTTNSLGTGEQSAALFVQVTPTTSTTAAPIPGQIGVPTLTGYSANEYRLSWNADTAVTTAFNSANPTVNPGAAYTVAYWRVFNRFYATSTVPLMNQGDVLQTQMIGPGSSTSGGTPSVLATCTQLIYTIRPSSQYMVTVAGKNSPVNWGSFSAFGFNSAGNPVGFKPQMTQTATAGAPQTLQLQNGNNSITTNSFAVQWNGPSWVGLSGITQYRITLSQEFGSRLIVTNLNNPNQPTNTARQTQSAVQYTATGLQSATNYIMNIRAVNSFGPSIPSQNLRVTTNSSSGFAAQTSFWTVVLMALAAVLAFAF